MYFYSFVHITYILFRTSNFKNTLCPWYYDNLTAFHVKSFTVWKRNHSFLKTGHFRIPRRILCWKNPTHHCVIHQFPLKILNGILHCRPCAAFVSGLITHSNPGYLVEKYPPGQNKAVRSMYTIMEVPYSSNLHPLHIHYYNFQSLTFRQTTNCKMIFW